MTKCGPGTPLDPHPGMQKPIKHRTTYEQQRINYEKNYSFYDGYIGEWYNRKKVMNELSNYFTSKCNARVVNTENKIENTVTKLIAKPEKKPKRKRKKKVKRSTIMNESIDEFWIKKEKIGTSLDQVSKHGSERNIETKEYLDRENRFTALWSDDEDDIPDSGNRLELLSPNDNENIETVDMETEEQNILNDHGIKNTVNTDDNINEETENETWIVVSHQSRTSKEIKECTVSNQEEDQKKMMKCRKVDEDTLSSIMETKRATLEPLVLGNKSLQNTSVQVDENSKPIQT